MPPTASDALVSTLRTSGVDTIFGLPGFQLDALFDALARDGSIRVIGTRHEQATSYMADGYARASGRVGVCLVVPGPGFLNAATGLATAYACGSPVLCLAGQVDSDLIDQGYGLPHEVPHQLEAARSVAKLALRPGSADQVAGAVAEALTHAAEGRPRPVVVELPLDFLGTPAGTDPRPAAVPERCVPDPAAIDRAALLLRDARRPLIAAGGGVIGSGAWDELEKLAERLAAPVVMSLNGRGAMPAAHPLAFEAHSFGELLPAADVVVAVGTRFSTTMGRRRSLRAGQRLVRIDSDPDELARGIDPAVAVEGDARLALDELAKAIAEGPHQPAWDELDSVREKERAVARSFQPQAAYGQALVDVLPEDTIVVPGMTQLGYWMRLGYPVRKPRTWLSPGYQATLGYEIPTGLGAQVACPDRRVVVVAGDGGAMYNIQELSTAVLHRIPVIVVVFNDGAYGNVRRTQDRQFEGRLIASELHNPDFMRLAGAFGVAGLRAESPDGLRSALATALAESGPVLIEVPVGEMPDPWPVLLRS